VPERSIDELAAVVRQGLAEDQREAEEDRLKLCPTCHKPIGDNIRKTLDGTKFECGHYFTWDRLFDLREREQQTTTRALARIAGLRALLDEALSWEHHHWPGVSRCQADAFPGTACACGRDARVRAVLQHLATSYQETT
jgi:hypothetical protein